MTPDGNSNEHRKNKEHWYKYVITKKKKSSRNEYFFLLLIFLKQVIKYSYNVGSVIH